MPDCLNYESTHPNMLHFIFLKLGKRSTLKGQCGLEDIVMKYLTNLNQSNHINTKLSISFHASFSRRMRTHWYPKLINKSLASGFSSTDFELNILVVGNIDKY